MLTPLLISAALFASTGHVTYLECQVVDRGEIVGPDTPYTLAVTLSFNPDFHHVETWGARFRTSTMGVGVEATEWWWDDWRRNVMGRSWIDQTTLAYRADRGELHVVGQCRERSSPLWFHPDP